MKKILCPTDFSDAALSGIAYAAKLAKKIDADLTLFNVVALTDLLPEEVLMGEQANTHVAKARLEVQSQEVSKVFKVSCYGETETSTSSMSQVIGSKAQGFDLLVMGTNGADDLAQFFLGSKTYRAIKKVGIPTIMVPEKTVYSDPKRIVYAYDHWRHDHLPLTQLISFLKLIGCSDLTVLQVMEESVSQNAEEELRQSQFAIQRLYQEDVNLKFDIVHAASTIEAINGYINKAQTDLLALCSEHQGFGSSLFHKSVIKAITGTANFPVLVFHA
jgi:nucleotide-binding universal stress UspA family protein